MISFKGVTPVVATVLLMAVTIGAAGTLYTVVQQNQEQTRENIDTDLPLNPNQLDVETCYNQSTNTYLRIRNTGQSAINSSKMTALLNGTIETKSTYSTSPEIVDPQRIFDIEFTNQFGPDTQIILTDGDQTLEYSCYQLT